MHVLKIVKVSLITVTLFFISGVNNISISQVKYVYHEKPTSILINYNSKKKISKKIPRQFRSTISNNSFTDKITQSGVEIINGSTSINAEPKKPNSEFAQLKSKQKNSNVSIVNISAVEVVNTKNLVEDGSIIEESVIDYTAFQKLLDDKSTVIFKNDFESNKEIEEVFEIAKVEEDLEKEVVEESKLEKLVMVENKEAEIEEEVVELLDETKNELEINKEAEIEEEVVGESKIEKLLVNENTEAGIEEEVEEFIDETKEDLEINEVELEVQEEVVEELVVNENTGTKTEEGVVKFIDETKEDLEINEVELEVQEEVVEELVVNENTGTKTEEGVVKFIDETKEDLEINEVELEVQEEVVEELVVNENTGTKTEEEVVKLIDETKEDLEINEVEVDLQEDVVEESKVEELVVNENTEAEIEKEIEEELIDERKEILEINKVGEELQEEIIEESKAEELVVNENTEAEIKEAVKEFPDGVKELKDNDSPEEEKTLNNNLQYTAHVEGDLSNSEFYYTVNIKTVSGPVEGLNFLTQVRDGDEIWDEYAFHLFKDAKNATKITLGKFAEREKATEVMNYLKTKNISNPTVEKFDNDMKIKSSAKSPLASKKIVSKTSSDLITVKTDEKLKLNPNTASLEKENKPKIISSSASPDKRTGNIAENISANINSSDNFYTVQVGAVDKISSNNIEGINLKKENLFFSDIGNLGYAINYGKYDNYENAHVEAVSLHKGGEASAFVTKYANGRRVKISVADYSSENVSDNTIKDDIEKLGYKAVTTQMKGKFIQLATIYNWDSHNFKTTFDSLERTVYFKINKSHAVQFFVGPFNESDLFIELRNVKNTIPDAFVKTI